MQCRNVCVGFVLFLALSVRAMGGDTAKFWHNTIYNSIDISAGIGISTIQWVITGPGLFEGGPHYITISPVYNGCIDYRFIKKISIGIAGAYQTVTDNPTEVPYSNNIATWATEQITRYNISTRVLIHFSQSIRNDVYTGLRIGGSIWTDKWLSYMPPHNRYYFPASLSMAPQSERFSFQMLFGYRRYITSALGFHIETGIGTPYFLEAGITDRISYKSSSHVNSYGGHHIE